MGMFITNFEKDPLIGRLRLLVYGRGKVGKTTCVLDLAAAGEKVILISADRGTLAVRLNPKKFQGNLTIAYPTDLKELRDCLEEAKGKAEGLSNKYGSEKVWVVLDHITHVQNVLLTESRKYAVTSPGPKSQDDPYVREMTTQVDYQVNVGHMNEIAQKLGEMPCHVVVLALEKSEKKGRDGKETGVLLPSIGGQAYNRFVGDADAVLHLVSREKDEVRNFETAATSNEEAGDRSGRLKSHMVASLARVRDVMLGIGAAKVTDPQTTPAEPQGAPAALPPATAPTVVAGATEAPQAPQAAPKAAIEGPSGGGMVPSENQSVLHDAVLKSAQHGARSKEEIDSMAAKAVAEAKKDAEKASAKGARVEKNLSGHEHVQDDAWPKGKE